MTAPLASNRPFWRLAGAQALLAMGDRIHQIALVWWTYAGSGSLALASLVLIATTLPATLIGPAAGALADRGDRLRWVRRSAASRFFVAACVLALALAGGLNAPVLLVATLALATASVFALPAAMASVPALTAEADWPKANGYLETGAQLAGLVGPALGGAIVGFAGVPAAFAANVAAFAAAGLLMAGLQAQAPSAAPGTDAGGSAAPRGWRAHPLVSGWSVLGEQPALSRLLVRFAALNFFSAPVLLFLPHFAKATFGRGAWGLGVLEAAVGCGMVAGALGISRLPMPRELVGALARSLAAVAALFIVSSLWPTFWGYAVALFGVGVAIAAINVRMMTVFQRRVPGPDLGRFMGVVVALTMGLVPLSFGAFGLLAGALDPVKLLGLNGLAIALVALSFKLERGETPEPATAGT